MFEPLNVVTINFSCNVVQRTVDKLLVVVIRINQLVFGIADSPLNGAWFNLFGIVVVLFKQQLNGVLGVLGIVD